MARKYLVWKDPACNGRDIQWVELTGEEFREMAKLPENKVRRFIKLTLDEDYPNEDAITIEATHEQYISWKKDQNHVEYRWRKRIIENICSLDAATHDGETTTYHELVGDKRVDVEGTAVEYLIRERLSEVLQTLSKEELKLIVDYYKYGRTLAQIGDELGIYPSTVMRRLNSITKRLREIF